MIYLENNQLLQEIYIPRQEYSSSSNPEYATKTELENAIENEVIRADEKYAAKTDLIPYATTGWVESQDYVNSVEMASAIASATTDMATKNWVKGHVSAAMASETARTEETYAKISTLDNYTPTSGFATINGSAITSGEAIVIETGGNYSAGTNIQIEDNVISVTGITVPTKLSDLDNDEGFITSGDIPTSNTAFTNDAGYITTADTQDFVTSGDVKTQIEGYGYITENALSGYSTTEEMNQAIDDAVSGKADSSAFSAYSTTSEVENMIASAKTEIEAEIPSLDGYATEVYVDNSVSGKVDTSAMTAYATTAFTEETYLKEHQSLAGLFASVDYVSSAKTIYFYDKDETQVGTIDATDFIKDGMVDSVYISGDTLYIVFNSDAGKETIEIPLSDIFDPSNYYTKDEVDSAITAATDGLASEVYVDNSVSGKADTTALTQYYTSAQTDTAISNAVSGLASTQYVDNSVSGKADTSEFSAYTPTSGFSTINGSAITEGGNITVEETPYSGGTNIQIEDHVISVTGITVPTKVSDLENDEGFITNEALSGLASETYVDNAVSGKADTSAVTADITAATAATTGWVENQGYLTAFTETDPVFTGSPAYGITSEDISNWNSVSGKVDTSAMTAYYTSGETNTAISNATSGLASTTYVDNSVSGKMDTSAMTAYATTGWVNEQGFITAFTETDPIFTGSPAYGITAQDIENWNAATGGSAYSAGQNINIDANNEISVTGITSYTGITSGDVTTALGYTPISGVDLSDYYTSAQTDSAITNAVSGKADTSRVDEIEEVTASALTDLKTSKQDTLVSGTNIKTINNESILGSGNITIQGGGGSGETFVELTKAQYEALTAYSENTTYVITDADAVNLDDFVTTGNLQSYYTSAETDTAIANAVSGKTDKVSVTANTGRQFPRWNTQGVVTGTTGNTVYEQSLNINGTSKTMLQTTNSSFGTIYAPTSAGSQGQPLLSNGSGAPVWGSYKFQFISQSAYDAITTKDSTTIYFIISEN